MSLDLSAVTQQIQARPCKQQGITGADGAGDRSYRAVRRAARSRNHSRNFVLCPGGAYDRSPCGTGTSAKIACLAADGKLGPGQRWRQESILGSVFEASYRLEDGQVLPQISGQAFITAEATLLIDESDPLAWGIPP
jgi:4-hydroxyproline epimerase